MRIDHRNIERRHEDIFIRYRNEPLHMLHQSLYSMHKKGGTCIVALTIADDILKNSPIRLDRRRCLVDDVFEDGVGGVELRYPGCELYHIPYISIIRR